MELPTSGGSTSLRLNRTALTVFDGSDYLVTAMVRTEGLEHARARVSVRMLDVGREPIEGAEFASPLVISDGAWQRVSVAVEATPGAVWMQIELQLLQGAVWRGAWMDDRSRELLPEDFEGSAYFDDLAVFQLPRVELAVSGEWPIARSAVPPEVTVALRDQAGERLRSRLRALGLDGVVVDEIELETPLDLTPIPWRPRLPGHGWYRVEASILNEAGVVGFAEASFGWVPRGRELAAQSRIPFGVVIESGSEMVLSSVASMVRSMGVGSVTLSAWPAGGSLQSGEAGSLDAVALGVALEELVSDGVELTMALAEVPTGIAAQAGVDRGAVLELLADTPADGWLPALAPLLSSFGERVRRWQVGGMGDGRALEREELGPSIRSVQSTLRRMIPRPVVVLPGRAEDDASWISGEVGGSGEEASLSMLLPHGVPESSVLGLVRDWASWTGLSVVVEPLPEELFGERASVLSLARRAVLALEGGASVVSVRRPWLIEPRTRREDLVMPMPEMVVMRRLLDELSDLSPGVRLPMGDGVEALLFEGERGSVLVAWNLGGEADRGVLDGYLGEGPIVAVDLWGNSIASFTGDQPVRLPLDESPVFVRGVDPLIVRMRAGIDLRPRQLPTRGALIAAELVVSNPFPDEITGRIRLVEPEGWELRPQIVEFAVERGERIVRQGELRIGVAELSGRRDAVLEVEVTADRRYPVLRIPVPVEVGLPNLHVLPMYRLVRGAGDRVDVVVEAMITNIGDRPVSCSVTVFAVGFPSEKAPLSNLLPGQVAIRRFGFAGGGATLPGTTALISIRETDGNDRLNVALPFQ